MGGRVTGLDPSKALLKRALENGELAEIDIDWLQGTAESIPFPDKSFDVVLSQYGHIFAPNAQRTIDEMLRILKPGGRLTVSVWDADHYMGLQFAILGRHGLKDFTAPIIWGRESERTRLFAGRLENIKNATGYLRAPCLSPNHVYRAMARSIWPVTQLLDQLSDDPVATRNLKQELLDLIVQSTEGTVIPQRYTIVTGVKS
jgi:SAM-dependent methyltransferase